MAAPIRYKDYRIKAVSTPEFGGTFRPRVALTFVRHERPLTQRFLDFECFPSKEAADDHALAEAKVWIDDQSRSAKTAFKAEFDTIL